MCRSPVADTTLLHAPPPGAFSFVTMDRFLKTFAPTRLMVFTLGLWGISSCRPPGGSPEPGGPGKAAREELNLAYGNHPHQKVDVYFPNNYGTSTPVVFLIHGGGFIFGLKEDFTMQARTFRDQGFITVNLSHRLVDTTNLFRLPPERRVSAVKISDEVKDVQAAVVMYREKAPGWGTGTGRMYMAGHSAGATLTMLYAQGDFNDDRHIRASANWAGATSLAISNDAEVAQMDPRLRELYYRAVGVAPSTANNLYYMAVSPYWVANNNAGSPTISIFPENNVVTNYPNEAQLALAQTRTFHNLLRNKGTAEKLSVYAGSDHGFSQPAGAWQRLIVETAAYFNER